jgi:murein DD-endopeptidase MepM/ murein hydrolase activator NlpD
LSDGLGKVRCRPCRTREGEGLHVKVNKTRLAVLALVLFGALQAVFVSSGALAQSGPSLQLPQADPTPSTDPSATPTSPSPEPTPTEPSPTYTTPTSDPSPSQSPTSAPTSPKADHGTSGSRSSGPRQGATAQVSDTEGCGSSRPNGNAGAPLWAPYPPYVVPEPPGMWGPQSTRRVRTILASWRGPSRIPLGKAFLQVAGPFPMAGVVSWTNDWHAYRACPQPHLHRGLDLFAAWGTPVVAAEHGVVSQIVNNPISGLGIEIRDRSGIEYFYAHLSSYAAGLHSGQVVRQGTVLGRVGTTGNAAGSAPHLHFEIQPGGRAMPPKPVVDGWLLVMEKRARLLVKEGTAALARERAREDSVSVMGLLGDPALPFDSASLQRPSETTDSFPVALVGAFAGIVLVGLGLESLRYFGRHSRRARRDSTKVPGEPTLGAVLLARWVQDDDWPDGVAKAASPESDGTKREAVVSLLGVGVIVVLTATAFMGDRPSRPTD